MSSTSNSGSHPIRSMFCTVRDTATFRGAQRCAPLSDVCLVNNQVRTSMVVSTNTGLVLTICAFLPIRLCCFAPWTMTPEACVDTAVSHLLLHTLLSALCSVSHHIVGRIKSVVQRSVEHAVAVQAATMPCLLAAGRDESAQGGVFACACSALLTTHRRCFDALMTPQSSAAGSHGAFVAWDAASVMKRERERVLHGCVLHLASCAAALRVRL